MIRRTAADYPLVLLALLLSAYGIAVVYSAGQTDVPVASVAAAWKRQLAWFAVAIMAFFVVTRASVRLLEWVAVPSYLFGVALLALTLVIGTGAGTASTMKGWITIGGVRLGQPAELAKIVVVLMVAKLLSSRREAPKSLLEL